MATEAPPSGSLVRWILPIVLVVAIVGALTWVSQNLPKGAIAKTENQFVPVPGKPADLQFLRTRAIWDAADPNYAKECETGVEGYYDFPFLNRSATPVTLGFAKSNCDCSHLRVVVLDKEAAATIDERNKKSPTEFSTDSAWTWTVLAQNEKDGVSVPPGGGGVARIQWDGRKGAGQRPLLRIKVWMHPTDNASERSFENLDVSIVMAEPLRFTPDRLALGTIGAGGQTSGEFLAWSPTRDGLELTADPKKVDPLFEVAIEKIDAKAATDLQEKFFQAAVAHLDPAAKDERLATLRAIARETRYRSAFRINVTLREQKDDKQLDQGPLSRELPVVADAIPFALHPPTVTAYVRGDVDVGRAEDLGKVNLNFPARDGVKKSIPVWSEAGNDLALDKVYPTVLDGNVKLTRNDKESTKARTKWSLEITVPPGALSGPLEDVVIYLRTTSPPRRVRIPVTGNAGQG